MDKISQLEGLAHQLAILQAWPRIWTLDYQEQIQLAVRVGLELRASKLQVQRSLTRPCCHHLYYVVFFFIWTFSHMIYWRSKIIVSVTYEQHFLHHLFSHFLSQLLHSLVKIIISIATLTTWQSKRRRVTNHYAAFTDNSSTNSNKANTILFLR